MRPGDKKYDIAAAFFQFKQTLPCVLEDDDAERVLDLLNNDPAELEAELNSLINTAHAELDEATKLRNINPSAETYAAEEEALAVRVERTDLRSLWTSFCATARDYHGSEMPLDDIVIEYSSATV